MNRINQMEPWIGQEEKKAMQEYLDSGGWLTEHKKTREFEGMLADYLGCRYAHANTSGTLSLMVSLMALGIGSGDEVICPDYTMIASASAISLVGATPALVDIDAKTLCLNVELTERAVTPKTKAVMYVSINGRAGAILGVREFCRRHKLFLVEDACQSLGSKCDDQYLGTLGDIGCLSFSFAKIITMGQGGAVVTNSKELSERVSMIRDFGRPKSGVDYHQILGLNSKITDLQAVIGIEQMKKLSWRVQRKKQIYELYREMLDGKVDFISTNTDCTPWFIDILVEDRDGLKTYLESKGIGSRPFYPPINTQPPFRSVDGTFTESSYVSAHGLWLPSSSFLSNGDVIKVCREIVKGVG